MTGRADPTLALAIEAFEREGAERVTVAELCRRFAALGYKVDRGDDCKHRSKWMTGPNAGRTFPACSTGLVEADTGVRAWHYRDARRDFRFEKMQALRLTIFAVTPSGHILTV